MRALEAFLPFKEAAAFTVDLSKDLIHDATGQKGTFYGVSTEDQGDGTVRVLVWLPDSADVSSGGDEKVAVDGGIRAETVEVDADTTKDRAPAEAPVEAELSGLVVP